jgi:hypothetical protein
VSAASDSFASVEGGITKFNCKKDRMARARHVLRRRLGRLDVFPYFDLMRNVSKLASYSGEGWRMHYHLRQTEQLPCLGPSAARSRPQSGKRRLQQMVVCCGSKMCSIYTTSTGPTICDCCTRGSHSGPGTRAMVLCNRLPGEKSTVEYLSKRWRTAHSADLTN